MKRHLLIASTILLSFTASAAAPYYMRGDIEFRPDEINHHMRMLPKIEQRFEQCLKYKIDTHQKNFRKYGFSTFYGDQSSYAKASRKERIAMVKQVAKSNVRYRYPDNFDFAAIVDNLMQPTSCIGLTLYCMGEAFVNSNSRKTWERIAEFTLLNDQTGTSLQYALQQLGWSIVYFNTNPSLNEQRDRFEYSPEAGYPQSKRGDHTAHYNEIKDRGRYFDFLVDDATSLVGFGHTMPESFRQVGMFVGVAHKGYHVFPGFNGVVVEGHSTMRLDNFDTIESRAFDPSYVDGAPRGEFHSGSIAIPPQYTLQSLEKERRAGINHSNNNVTRQTNGQRQTTNRRQQVRRQGGGLLGRLLRR